MVDENADRSYASGQQPASERDIEPLWPAAEADSASWSPASDDQGQPPTPPGPTPVPAAWASAPSDAARAWAPRPDSDLRGAVADVPTPHAPSVVPTPSVNLDQPFSLDPTGPAPGTSTGGRPTGETSAGSGPVDDRAAWEGRGGTTTESPWVAPPQRPAPEDTVSDPGSTGGDRRAGRAALPTPYPTIAGPPPPGPPPAGPPPGPYPPPAHGSAVPPVAGWTPTAQPPPTAEDFARRRQLRPSDPMATMGVRAMANRMGLRLPPGRHEQEMRRDIEMVRRNFGGLRQVTVVNPKGGAGKTVAILLLAMTFGQKRGGYVLAWDNNETQGTLGMRAQQDFHARTVRDLLRDLNQFHGSHGRVGDLSQYVRAQGEGMFDVLASDESATGGGMLTAAAFAEIREVVSRFYKLIFVDTGNNVRAQNWQAAIDATDQLVVTMSARNDSAETAARMLDHLEQSGRQRLVRQAVTVVSMPPSRKEIDLPAIQAHFAARTRAVLLAPYERLVDSGEPLRYGALSSAARDAWLKIAAAVAEGL
ncbi:chromosome partitioning protein [Salinispora tropica]|uniref:ATPase involved in chromosome partitioning-like protein n=1 Tax=Salinispora tropica (strain ATCC BAA-916 / DSM 44818 / JCM 13857 / NBRC 105044 / CNB-440) TaxID=369723 RepID=A4X167_SALTO|nr:chromosome partitioning protein [Salinispora tropica]ABP52617.1 ATPase involved in chromosome partitioning-like protein [Salinispora tropica CNB-440]